MLHKKKKNLSQKHKPLKTMSYFCSQHKEYILYNIIYLICRCRGRVDTCNTAEKTLEATRITTITALTKYIKFYKCLCTI